MRYLRTFYVLVLICGLTHVIGTIGIAEEAGKEKAGRGRSARLLAKSNTAGRIGDAKKRTEKTAFTLSTNEVVRPSLDAVSPSDVKKYSAEIDALIDAKLMGKGIAVARTVDNPAFVRRAYLDIVGRIPTLDETSAYLESKSSNRRSELIDELLNSYGYVSRQFNYWADVLRVKSDLRNVSGQPYVDFVKDSLSRNTAYDDFVRAMLTSNGPNLKRGNGAVGYYLRDANMQEDNMSNTVRVFLGTRLECAQCHDHPFDIWSQRDYFEMVAFTGGIQYRSDPDSEHAEELKALRNDQTISREDRQAIRRVTEALTTGIGGSGNGLARLPEDYEAGEGDPNEVITAKTMFEKESLVNAKVPPPRKRRNRNAMKKFPQRIQNAPELESRKAYASWLADPENPRFTTVIANRLWKQAMGMGLIEPVDTLTDDTTASNPELMEYLADLMVTLDFDMKQFLRVIYNTNVYQRAGDADPAGDPADHCFNGPIVRRMDAEQVWDSLLTLTVTNVDKRSTNPQGRGLRYLPVKDIYAGYERLRELDAEQFKTLAVAYSKRRTGNRKAVMEAVSDLFDKDQIAPARGSQNKQAMKRMAALNQKMQKAKSNKDWGTHRKLAAERKELTKYMRQKQGNLVRASELPSPAKPGHFLREFGQSDREQIENANKEPAVTQSLSLMNGMVEKSITNSRHSVLMSNIEAVERPYDKVRVTYLTMLNRPPNNAERSMWTKLVATDDKGVNDLIWTLANSVEFMFVK